MFTIKNLTVSTSNKVIIKALSLTIRKQEIHVLMGPNGSGKSTLSLALVGHPSYQIDASSKVILGATNLLSQTADERARQGLFLTFQQPIAIPGLSVQQLIKVMMDHLYKASPLPFAKLRKQLENYCELLQINPEFLSRSIHESFSGGEQKRLEMLQLLMAKPKIAILDEIDSGLDVDAIKVIAKAVEYTRDTHKTSFLIITHYRRILDHISPNQVHIMKKGTLIKSGDASIIDTIEKHGYQQFK